MVEKHHSEGKNVQSTLQKKKSINTMYGHTYSKSMDQPGKVANPTRG